MTNYKLVREDLTDLQNNKRTAINFKDYPYKGDLLDLTISYNNDEFKLLYNRKSNNQGITFCPTIKIAKNIDEVINILKAEDIFD